MFIDTPFVPVSILPKSLSCFTALSQLYHCFITIELTQMKQLVNCTVFYETRKTALTLIFLIFKGEQVSKCSYFIPVWNLPYLLRLLDMSYLK